MNGIIMIKGALSMQTAVKMNIPEKYDALLFTQALLDKYDTLTWQGTNFIVREIEDIYDVYSLSYRIAKLVKPPPHVEPAFLLF
jgi:hypothetical protein